MRYAELQKVLNVGDIRGRNLTAVVKRLEPRLFDKIQGPSLSKNLYLAMGNKHGVCLICGQDTRFLGYKKGFKKFCSNKCANRGVSRRKPNRSRPHLPFIEELEKLFIRRVDPRGLNQKVGRRDRWKKIVRTAERLGVRPKQVIYHMYVDRRVGRCEKCEDVTNFGTLERGYRRFCCATCANESIAEKTKKTCLERYGFKSVMCVPKVKQRYRDTCVARLGVDHPRKSEIVQRKAKATLKKNYGVDYPHQSKTIRSRYVKTLRKNYGVDTPMHSVEILTRQQKSMKSSKIAVIAGVTFVYQGYELPLLRKLVKRHGPKRVLSGDRVRPVSYKYRGRKRRYFPDAVVDKTIYEVKSTWTFPYMWSKTLAKAKACRLAGFRFVCVVLDKKGKILLCAGLRKSLSYYKRLILERA
jgi:hypothetical protein